MCNLNGVIYFLVFIVTVIGSSDVKDEPAHVEKGIKSSKRHHKIKLPKTSSNNDFHANVDTIKDYGANINEQEIEELIKDGKSEGEEPASDKMTEDVRKMDDDSNFLSSLTRRMNIDLDNIDDFEDNYENNNDYENAEAEIGRNDLTNSNDATETGEVLIYTPNRKSLSQDIVLDLKARTGYLESDERESADPPDGALSNFEHNLHYNTNERSGFVVHENGGDDFKPAYDVNYLNRPNSAYNNDVSAFYRSSNFGPIMQNYFAHHNKRFPQIFNNFKSREQGYVNPSSRENNWLNNPHGLLINTMHSYFGNSQPNAQTNYPKSEICTTCQGKLLPFDNFRRSVEAHAIFETTNGRSLDFEPSEGNSYPYMPIEDRLEEVLHVTDTSGQGELRTSNEMRASEVVRTKNNFGNNGVEQSVRNYVPDMEPLTNLMTPYFQNPILINRRLGIGGFQKFVG